MRQLRLLINHQLDMQRELIDKQLQLQRERMAEQLDLQREHMEKQLLLLDHQDDDKNATAQPLIEDELAKLDETETSNGEALRKGPKLAKSAKPEELVVEANPIDVDDMFSDILPPLNVSEHWELQQGANVSEDYNEDPGLKEVLNKVSKTDLDKAKGDLDMWTRCSGLHTVDTWVKNYRKHPGAWGALLMIQGVPEVTGRLRQKVQNYAIFSALFLAGSIKSLSGPHPVACPSGKDTWECHTRKCLFSYGLTLTVAAHLLTIFLAMAFHNALNEAARDSDVYRMFARGKGFLATVRCQSAFRTGAFSCCVALTALAQETVGWDIVGWCALLVIVAFTIYVRTSEPLFSNASIVNYWREELGGKPDPTDPYDLSVPLACLEKRAEADREGLEGYDSLPSVKSRTSVLLAEVVDVDCVF